MLTVIDSSFWQFTSDTIQHKWGSDLMIIKGGEHSFFMWRLNLQNMENVSLKVVEKLQETKKIKKQPMQSGMNRIMFGHLCD